MSARPREAGRIMGLDRKILTAKPRYVCLRKQTISAFCAAAFATYFSTHRNAPSIDPATGGDASATLSILVR